MARTVVKSAQTARIPRPVNAFILFRNEEIRRMAADNGGKTKQSQLSKVTGEKWNSLSQDEQKPYRDRAKMEKMDHERKYPGYRYQPQRKKVKKSRAASNTDLGTTPAELASNASTTPAAWSAGPSSAAAPDSVPVACMESNYGLDFQYSVSAMGALNSADMHMISPQDVFHREPYGDFAWSTRIAQWALGPDAHGSVFVPPMQEQKQHRSGPRKASRRRRSKPYSQAQQRNPSVQLAASTQLEPHFSDINSVYFADPLMQSAFDPSMSNLIGPEESQATFQTMSAPAAQTNAADTLFSPFTAPESIQRGPIALTEELYWDDSCAPLDSGFYPFSSTGNSMSHLPATSALELNFGLLGETEHALPDTLAQSTAPLPTQPTLQGQASQAPAANVPVSLLDATSGSAPAPTSTPSSWPDIPNSLSAQDIHAISGDDPFLFAQAAQPLGQSTMLSQPLEFNSWMTTSAPVGGSVFDPLQMLPPDAVWPDELKPFGIQN